MVLGCLVFSSRLLAYLSINVVDYRNAQIHVEIGSRAFWPNRSKFNEVYTQISKSTRIGYQMLVSPTKNRILFIKENRHQREDKTNFLQMDQLLQKWVKLVGQPGDLKGVRWERSVLNPHTWVAYLELPDFPQDVLKMLFGFVVFKEKPYFILIRDFMLFDLLTNSYVESTKIPQGGTVINWVRNDKEILIGTYNNLFVWDGVNVKSFTWDDLAKNSIASYRKPISPIFILREFKNNYVWVELWEQYSFIFGLLRCKKYSDFSQCDFIPLNAKHVSEESYYDQEDLRDSIQEVIAPPIYIEEAGLWVGIDKYTKRLTIGDRYKKLPYFAGLAYFDTIHEKTFHFYKSNSRYEFYPIEHVVRDVQDVCAMKVDKAVIWVKCPKWDVAFNRKTKTWFP